MSWMMTKELASHRDNTCDVSLRELQVVSSQELRTVDLPVHADWIQIDRPFFRVFAGACLLMLGSAVMILASLDAPEAAVAPVKPVAVAVAAPAEPVALTSIPDTQVRPMKQPAPHLKRRGHKLAVRGPAKAKLALRQAKPRRRLATR